MSKVTEYKGYQVPEGAESFDYGENCAVFFKQENQSIFFCNMDGINAWRLLDGPSESYERAIPLPDQPQSEPEQWQPKVGEECELKYKHSSAADWFPFRLVVVDGGIMFGWSDEQPINLKPDNYKFRPLKTEEEKARDEFIERCLKLTGLNDDISTEGFGIAYDNGARFTTQEGE